MGGGWMLAVTEPETCLQCGGTARRPATRDEWLRAWFNSGRLMAGAVRCADCGAASSHGGWYTLARPAGRRNPLRALGQIVTAIQTGRHWQPVPRFYAIIGGVSLVPAAVVAALVPRRRALVLVGLPLAVMVGGFVWSLASLRDRQVRRDISRRLNPQRALARDVTEDIKLLRAHAPQFRLLAPLDWAGELTFGGCARAWSPGQPVRVTEILVTADHGPQVAEQPSMITTRTAREPDPAPDDHYARTLAGLERRLDPPPALPEDADRAAAAAQLRTLMARDEARVAELAGAWTDGHLVVDGREVPARILPGDGATIALLELDGQQVTVEVVGLPLDHLELASVREIAPLLEGFRRRRS